MRKSVHGQFEADPRKLGLCVDGMGDLRNEVQSMFDVFEAGVSTFNPWAGDGTDQASQQFQLGWQQKTAGVREIALPLEQSVDGLTHSTQANLRTIESTEQSAHDQVRDHRSRTEAMMGDDYESGSDSDSRH